MLELKGRKVYASVEDVQAWDYPDFCDAHFCDCIYDDGTPLSEEDVESLHDLYPDVLWEMAYDSLH